MEILIVGNYCHDTIIRPNGTFEGLGGAASYISAAIGPTRIPFKVISKVGTDFLYSAQVAQQAIRSQTHPTSHFIDRIFPGGTTSHLSAVCEPIFKKNISDFCTSLPRAKIGIVCGVALEILPETLIEVRNRVDYLICDAQGLLRGVGADRQVSLVKLSKTLFTDLVSMIDLLKMNELEAKYMDTLRPKGSTWITTRGERGTSVIQDGFNREIFPKPVQEIDSTGAGDSFTAGLAIGFLQGRSIEAAVELGNHYGAFATTSSGIPDFSLL